MFVEQQDIQSIHSIRSQRVARRTAQANQIRGLLMEYGVVIPKGISYVRKSIDQMNKRYGKGAVFFARQGIKRTWSMARNFKSPAYTTRISDLPIVRI